MKCLLRVEERSVHEDLSELENAFGEVRHETLSHASVALASRVTREPRWFVVMLIRHGCPPERAVRAPRRRRITTRRTRDQKSNVRARNSLALTRNQKVLSWKRFGRKVSRSPQTDPELGGKRGSTIYPDEVRGSKIPNPGPPSEFWTSGRDARAQRLKRNAGLFASAHAMSCAARRRICSCVSLSRLR